ncbi:hypothetical protein AB4K05_14130 [Kluyvera sp. STS39-E]|uniref:hypothetical protein n=1 Tax=Kluyvera TaxID=579 RepID=UPI001A243C1E|nr:hypothetical protein [Kluyvera sp. EC_51]MBW9460468.1 hypothetical protein [Kluyvera sp. EC_51]BCT15457.1 hypothetical protein R1TS_34850 [Enterobacter cloacae]HAT1569282.1 hypothetical protein [Kluyvera cryocrescens]HCR1883882.1 hypothetical protein [Enterobacter roggenkampii]
MLTIILFGAGRSGVIWPTEEINKVIKVPDCQVKAREILGGRAVMPDVEYQVFEFLVDGKVYLIGVNGDRPSDDVIKSHIRHGDPKPRPYKTL